jgi:hypothetical protein
MSNVYGAQRRATASIRRPGSPSAATRECRERNRRATGFRARHDLSKNEGPVRLSAAGRLGVLVWVRCGLCCDIWPRGGEPSGQHHTEADTGGFARGERKRMRLHKGSCAVVSTSRRNTQRWLPGCSEGGVSPRGRSDAAVLHSACHGSARRSCCARFRHGSMPC